MNIAEIVLNGALIVAIPLALLAGLVSFASPCVLPLVPGYLGYVSGMSQTKSRVVLGSVLFVAGFAAVFVGFGSFFGAAGAFLASGNFWLNLVAGSLVAILGLALMGNFGFLQKTIKPSFRPKVGLAGAPILGMVFAIGWSPCIGPTLAAVLTLAGQSGSAERGAILAFSYALGLGIPFILLAAGFSWASGSVDFLKRNIRVVNVFGGLLLVVLGVMIATGVWDILVNWMQGWISDFVPAI